MGRNQGRGSAPSSASLSAPAGFPTERGRNEAEKGSQIALEIWGVQGGGEIIRGWENWQGRVWKLGLVPPGGGRLGGVAWS